MIKLLSTVVILIMLTSCEKCIKCEYTYTNPNTKEQETYDYDEYCGSRKDADNFEEMVKDAAAKYDGNYTCKEQ